MKKSLNWILCCGVCLLSGTALGQSMYNYNSPVPATRSGEDTNRVASREADQTQKFCTSKDLAGANVKDAQGNKLGDIDEVLINPQSGEAFVAIGVEDGRQAVVPVQALQVTPARGLFRNAEVSLNKSKEALESGPTIEKNEWQTLDNPGFTQRIYSHYGVQQPRAMGGVGSESMGGAATGAGSSDTRKDQPKHGTAETVE